MDKVGFQNVRGLNDPIKQYEIKSLILKILSSMLVVLESKVRENNWKRLVENCGNGFNLLHNYTSSSSGRIWFLWDSRKMRIREIGQNDQILHVEVENFLLKTSFIFSMVYVASLLEERSSLW